LTKKLLFTAALLVPGLAYSANPTANLTVQVAPAGSGLAVPTEAAAAGFTTLAANFDFSQPFYATRSNWLDCAGTNASLPWHVGAPGVDTSAGCTSIVQATDPLTGQPAMFMPHTTTQDSGGGTGGWDAVQMITHWGNQADSVGTPLFPNMYVEATYRDTSNATGQNAGVWNWQSQTGVPGAIEFDYGEIYNGGYTAAGTGNWGNGQAGGEFFNSNPGNNNLAPGFAPTNYHKYGGLITSDGATAIWNCLFVDDRLQKCINPRALSAQYQNKYWLVISNNATPVPVPVETDLWIKSIKVWTCPNWQTQMCNGSTLVTTTQSGVTWKYWH
jgi:hypothetical protein